MTSQKTINIADSLRESAATFPNKPALKFPEARDRAGRVAYTQLTFRQLDELVDRYAAGFQNAGVRDSMRCLLMVKPCLEFTALTFALFRAGAVPVMIDPGMGIPGFLRCVRQARPSAMIGIPKAHLLRLFCRKTFAEVKHKFTLGHPVFPGTLSLGDLERGHIQPEPVETKADDMAAILFTSGSTGPAKGVVYTHRIFTTQLKMIRDTFGIGPEDTDLPCFPLFALFSTGVGACAVIPDMDPTRPAQVDPARIVEAIESNGVTYSFGSPALWRVVAGYCAENDIRLNSVNKVFMAGAPVPGPLHKLLLDKVLPEGAETHAPYGATECLPVADLPGTTVATGFWEKTQAGKGVCVGRPVPGIDVKILEITDAPVSSFDEVDELPVGGIGEITVTGPVVTPEYFGLPEKTQAAKIMDLNGRLWHRMGDLGYLDEDGRIWVCGRKSQRVETEAGTLFTVQCEAVFNAHPKVHRTALVGVDGTPVLVVEPLSRHMPVNKRERESFTTELLALGAEAEPTRSIQTVLFHPAFPVDVRHNAKIGRETLAEWATGEIRTTNRQLRNG
jgi:acyl-CoA synthetase (AMP-forming)/AMP-acid ligase II